MKVISQSKIKKSVACIWLMLAFMPLCAVSALAGPLVIQAVGDIMLGGQWESQLAANNYFHAFENIAQELNRGDITIANLEAPLTDRGNEFEDKKFRFRVNPAAATALKKAGITTVNLANNHIMDFGPIGLADTVEALKKVDIDWVGAGDNLAQARGVQFYELRGLKVAMLGYSMTLPTEFWASKRKAGTMPAVEKLMCADIAAARKEASVVVVSIHWGEEGATRLRPYQPRLARLMIDSGADVVIGHHPHRLQGVERYKNGIVFYSLGNFAFAAKGKHGDSTMLVRFSFDGGNRVAELLPVNIRYNEVGFQPAIMNGKRADRLIDEIRKLPPGDPGIIKVADRYFVPF
jgi:poly-gamma-glutamate synthesis protein (capsule biosynthesis protein)